MIVLCQLLKTASECACVVTPEVFGSGQNDHSKRICYSKSAKKEKLLITNNILFSHSVFKRLVLQTRKNKGHFVIFEIVFCKLFQFGKVLKFVVWERVKSFFLLFTSIPSLLVARQKPATSI